jgi:hypothetical protein
MKKYLLILSHIILYVLVGVIGYFEYQYYNSIYHTLLIIAILSININIWYQSTHTKILYLALKKWLGWK